MFIDKLKKFFSNIVVKVIFQLLIFSIPFVLFGTTYLLQDKSKDNCSINISSDSFKYRQDQKNQKTEVSWFGVFKNYTFFTTNKQIFSIECFTDSESDSTYALTTNLGDSWIAEYETNYTILGGQELNVSFSHEFDGIIDHVKIDEKKCEFYWVDLWSSYKLWWIIDISLFCVATTIYELLLWFKSVKKFIVQFESYWWAVAIIVLTMFMYFGIIIPFIKYGPWTWFSFLIPITTLLLFIIVVFISYYWFSYFDKRSNQIKTELKKDKVEEPKKLEYKNTKKETKVINNKPKKDNKKKSKK